MVYLCACGFVHDRLDLPLASLDVHANSASLVVTLRDANKAFLGVVIEDGHVPKVIALRNANKIALRNANMFLK